MPYRLGGGGSSCREAYPLENVVLSNLRKRLGMSGRIRLADKASGTHRQRARDNRLLFERLEQRVVLSNGPLAISEFMAINNSGLTDQDGEYSDWIEIYNPTDQPINLDGWYLTDDANDLTLWQFPQVWIGAGGHEVVFASNKDRNDPLSELHTNFRLSGDGEYLALVQPGGITVAHDFAPSYPAQVEDISYGVIQGSVTLLAEGAPVDYHVPEAADDGLGTTWTDPDFNTSSWSGSRQVLITEAGTASPDYFEIQNVSGNDLNTTGWFVAVNIGTDIPADINAVTQTYWNLPPLMASGALAYANDVDPVASGHGFGTGILWSTKAKGWVMIHDGVDQVIDFVPWGYDSSAIASMSTMVNGLPVTGADLWTGFGVTFSATFGESTIERIGNMDNNDAGDFQSVNPSSLPSNLGVQNPDLSIPFVASPGSGATTGLGFSETPADFAAAIQTDVAEEMLGVNASLWTRTEFDVQDTAALDMLTLRMQYNDGFVAYLNGQEIASRYAPGLPAWDSTALMPLNGPGRSVTDSMTYEEINVSSGLVHLQDGTNVLAIHGLNNAAADPNFLIRPELVGTSNQGLQRFFATATPGAPNDTGFVSFVEDTKFSTNRGFFDQAFNVAITTATSGATIYYTTDGSVPSVDNGQIYNGPLAITTTTTLRAIAVKEGFEPTNVDTQTYIRAADVATQVRPDGYPTSWTGEPNADYEVDQSVSLGATYGDRFLEGLTAIPTMSLVLPVDDMFSSSGLYSLTNSTGLEKATSAELIYADGREGFQIDAGLSIQGGASRTPDNAIKHSLSLRFRNTYGEGRLDYPLFEDSPVNSYDALHLRAMYNNSWIHWDQGQRDRGSMIRDQWMRDSLLAMGQEDAGRGDYVHLYINGLYWGVYNIHERQEATHYTDYNGGDDTGVDALKSNEAVDGTTSSWTSLLSFVQNTTGGGITASEFAQIQAKIDVTSLIDYMIINHYGGNDDWDHHNWRAVGGGTDNAPWRLYSWDAERVLEGATVDRTEVNNAGDPSQLYHNLRNSEEFRLMFADRLHQHFFNDGALTPAQTAARWMNRADQLDLAIVAESARWGDDREGGPYLRDTKWIPEQNRLINTYFPVRSDVVLEQYKDDNLYPDVDAPVFQVNGVNQHGDQILPSDDVAMTATAGTIYYTLDGSDPRSLGAPVYAGTNLNFAQTTLVRSRTLDGGVWSAMNEAIFYVGAPAAANNLAVTELNYHPLAPTMDELLVNPNWIADDFEFIELLNTSNALVDLTGVELTDGVQFDFADSSVIALGAGERIVLVKDLVAFTTRYGTQFHGQPITVAGQYTTTLDDGGERIMMIDRFGDPIQDFEYDDSRGWPNRADGNGSSLEAIYTSGNYNADDNWRSSSEFGGSPGAEGEGPVDSVVVNEVLSRPVAPDVDAIELFNPTAGPINIGGWFLSNSNDNYEKFRIPDGTILESGDYLVFDETDFNSMGGLDSNDFTLDGIEGDDVWLLEADGAGKLTTFVDHVEFGAALDGVSIGRWPNGTGELVLMVEATLGSENGSPRVGAVVINELHVDPAVKTQPVEYVELYNMSNAPVDLSGWSFTNGITYTFPGGTTLAAGDYVLVSENPSAVQSIYHVASFGPFIGSLSNGGERVVLRDADGMKQDEVDYGMGFPWPTVGDASGYSMELINPSLDNDLSGSWRSSSGAAAEQETLVAAVSDWKYFKGTEEPSAVSGEWREIDFPDGSWTTAQMPIGYDDDGQYTLSTVLGDMRDGYTTVYLRKEFQVAVPGAINALMLEAMYDDGINVWINGTHVAGANVDSAELAYDATANASISNEGVYVPHTPPNPSGYLVAGTNVIAVQLLNRDISDSDDAIFDALLRTSTGGSAGITPGELNSVFAINAPPQMRQVEHSPQQPRSNDEVTVTVKVTDPDGVGSVTLDYQLVEAGDYIEINDPRYTSQWTTVTMVDDGTGGDEFAGDDRYTAVLPGTVQTHRRLVRYRINVADTLGASVRGPYADDPQPNFAYYVYDGVPSWTGADRPGGAQTTYDSETLTSVPTYQLITTRRDHIDSQHIPDSSTGTYGGSDYLWQGALVYDGVVYDHINYRARGGVWRYSMGKNMWKFDFNRGHYFQAHDDYGNPYDTKWDKLNFSALIQQGNFRQRGEQGLFEGAGFALHNLAGNMAPKTNYAQFRIVENADQNGVDQYSGDFQGLYMVIEQPDGRLLDEHNLPDGNLYKMEGGTGTLNNQGPDQPTNRADLNAFMSAYRSNPTQQWWEDNLDLEDYYNFRAISMAIHDYDMHSGKNYFYYHNPENDKWSVMNWDLDLTWTTTYGGGGGTGPLNDYVFQIPQFRIDYNSRVRELVDLLFNVEQTGMLLDETASFVNTPGQPSVVDADRAMWDYNPILTSSYINMSKADHGKYYENAPGRTFEGMVTILKNYVGAKVNGYLAGSAYAFDPKVASDEGQQPDTPVLSYFGPEGFPLDELRFQSSVFSGGSGAFSAMKWRIAEVTDPNDANFDPTEPRKYEATAHWESDEITTFNSTAVIPSDGLLAGKTYRVRVRMKDSDGRWSHWSDPVQLVAGDPSGSPSVGLRVTEIMYHPTEVTADELAVNSTFNEDDFEFIELTNTTGTTLDLSGVRFDLGIKFDFTANNVTALAPNEIIVLASNIQAFQARYGVGIAVAGQFDDGKLSDGGEQITLVDSYNEPILDFTYDDEGSWPGRADGNGSSIEVLNTQGDYNDGDNWRSSIEYAGSPGVEGTGWLGQIVINEVLTHTDPPLTDPDSIELFNTTGSDIAIGGWYLSDSNENYKKYRIPDGTILTAGAYLVFDESHFNPTPGSPGINDFALNAAHGDDVYLMATDANDKLTMFVDHVDFGASINGESFGRWPNGAGDPYPMSDTSFGDANIGPRVGPILISEVHYNPGDTVGADDLEFIELFNPTNEAVDLTNWRIRKGVDFDFTPDTTIEPRSTLVVVSFDPADPLNGAKLAAFHAEFSIDGSVPLVGPYTGRLADGGEKVQLQRPDEPPAEEPGFIPRLIEDEVIYDDVAPWPTDADGRGSSLHRVDTGLWGNDSTSWTGATPSPGISEIELPAAEVVGRHVFYNNSHFDGLDSDANAADAAAIATDKQALLAGEIATSANYTNYSRGLNGIMIDIVGLLSPGSLNAIDDFSFKVGNSNTPDDWTNAPAPAHFVVRPGDGEGGSDRVTVIWADNAIENQWLQVTVVATPNTGLAAADVSHYGNAIGEAGDRSINAIVNATDEIAARNFQHGATNLAAVDDPYDYDRDRLVNGTDQIIARNNQTNPLSMLRLIDLTSLVPLVGFVAFNDHIAGGGTHVNTTTYDTVDGGTASGPLVDIVTGEPTEVTLTITESGVVIDGNSTPPAAGTDAANVFNTYVDFSSAANASLEIGPGASYTHTFTGLDQGDDYTYNLTGTSIRGKSGAEYRWTLVTLVGADASELVDRVRMTPDANLHVWFEVSPTEIAINAGTNQGALEGCVAAWTGIDPGDDGQFSIVSTFYTGEIPSDPAGEMAGTASDPAADKSYAITGIRFEAVPAASKNLAKAAETNMEDFDWLYEFEQMNSKSDASKKSMSVENAVDQLMASDWA